MNPYWPIQTMGQPNPYIPVMPSPYQPSQQSPPPPSQTPPAQVTQPTSWTWKVVKDYQTMLQEPIPVDGTPIMFMMSESSTFYIVKMTDGKKMVNGYEFTPLNSVEEPAMTPEEQTNQRLSNLENALVTLSSQIEKLTEVRRNEPYSEVIEPSEVQRKSITEPSR